MTKWAASDDFMTEEPEAQVVETIEESGPPTQPR